MLVGPLVVATCGLAEDLAILDPVLPRQLRHLTFTDHTRYLPLTRIL